MAFLDVHCFSEALGLSVSFHVLLPQKTAGQIGMAGGEKRDKYQTLYLLQCRAVTTGGSPAPRSTTGPAGSAPVETLERVPLFAGLERHEAEQIARLCKERRFAAGETVVMEGSGGAAFFLIDSGEATVTVHGAARATLKAGDHFGEIALIDEGPRAATITATTELVCHGLTFWEFRPLVQGNGMIAWKLLQSMAQMLRDAQLQE